MLLISAAAVTDSATTLLVLDGSQNRFDLVVAGSVARDWVPEADSWGQGNPDAYAIALTGAGSRALSPGGSTTVSVAVRNASPSLAGTLSLDVRDPRPRGDARDPKTGRFVELFDQLVFTVTDDAGVVLFDAVPADELTTYRWSEEFAPGEEKVLRVEIALPESVDNRWQGASTDVQFHFHGENV